MRDYCSTQLMLPAVAGVPVASVLSAVAGRILSLPVRRLGY